MSLIDIGVNFHSERLKRLAPELLTRAAAAGVSQVLATGTSLEASEGALRLAREYSCVRATAGLHPHVASHFDARTHERLQQLWQDPLVVAVGECGLDYNRMFSSKQAQLHAFEQQLKAAVACRKPLFLHCRDAHEDFLPMLKAASEAGATGVVHCFTGTVEQCDAYLALGFDIGVTGWVTDLVRGHDLRHAVKSLPLERLHLETDAPYLRPRNAPKGRSYNEPALLPHVAEEIARLKELSVEAVMRAATANSRRLFGLRQDGAAG